MKVVWPRTGWIWLRTNFEELTLYGSVSLCGGSMILPLPAWCKRADKFSVRIVRNWEVIIGVLLAGLSLTSLGCTLTDIFLIWFFLAKRINNPECLYGIYAEWWRVRVMVFNSYIRGDASLCNFNHPSFNLQHPRNKVFPPLYKRVFSFLLLNLLELVQSRRCRSVWPTARQIPAFAQLRLAYSLLPISSET